MSLYYLFSTGVHKTEKTLPLLNPNEQVALSLQPRAETLCQCASRALCAGLFPWTSWACQGSVPALNSASRSTACSSLALSLHRPEVSSENFTPQWGGDTPIKPSPCDGSCSPPHILVLTYFWDAILSLPGSVLGPEDRGSGR